MIEVNGRTMSTFSFVITWPIYHALRIFRQARCWLMGRHYIKLDRVNDESKYYVFECLECKFTIGYLLPNIKKETES